MKNNIHNINFVYFISANNLTDEKWDFLGKAPIRLTGKSYYFDLQAGVELIEKVYKNYYWQTVSMCFEVCFADKEKCKQHCHIMDNEKIQKWFALFRNYQYLTDEKTYAPTTFWKLLASMYAEIYENIKEQRREN